MSKIIPVIHTIDWDQIEYNINLCRSNGIDRVFLINHKPYNNPVQNLCEDIIKAKALYPDMWIGANFLQLNIKESFIEANNLSCGIDAIWTDTSIIDVKDDNLENANDIISHKGKFLHFGGVAFKYQKQPNPLELKWICENSVKYMDVITTSGDRTGHPPTVEKIELIRSYIGNHPLCIASGITPENKSDYSNLVDYMLVASSITNPRDERIIESKLKELIK